MRRCLLTYLFSICLMPVFSQTVYPGSLANTDPTFNRPNEGMPPTTLSTQGTNVYYNLITINIPAAGYFTFSNNSLWDNFSVLYDTNGFNPALPLTNALVANDDFGGTNSEFTYNFTSPGIYYLVICSFKNNVTGPYTLSYSPTVVLPLNLLSFTAAKATGSSNIIKWSVANESNLNTYQVQQGTDGKNFKDLINGDIAAKNNTGTTSYSFVDDNPAEGYNYYRLKIAEKSGRISYSLIAVVKNSSLAITNLKIFPNPASDFLQIEAKSAQNNKAFISVINSIGEIVLSGKYSFNNQSLIPIDIKKLPAGKYFLKAIINNDETMLVFIKQ